MNGWAENHQTFRLQVYVYSPSVELVNSDRTTLMILVLQGRPVFREDLCGKAERSSQQGGGCRYQQQLQVV